MILVGRLVAAALVLARSPIPWAGRALVAAMLMPIALLGYALGIRPRVTMEADEIRLVGPVRTMTVKISDVSHAAGGSVLSLHMRDGGVLISRAIANTNPTLLLRREGRTEAVAAALNAAIAERREQDRRPTDADT